MEMVLLDLSARRGPAPRLAPDETVTMLRGTVFALTHPLLGDERLARPDRIVDLVLHGVVRTHPRTRPRC